MFEKPWRLLKDTVVFYIEDDALSRGASIAFYATTSLAPILLIVVAIAGLAFGRDTAQAALTGQFRGLMGEQSAQLLQTALDHASSGSSGILATIIGTVTLLVTASGVFGEIQAALNAIWKAQARGAALSRLVRARLASLGLVAALGFMLLVSLVISAVVAGLGNVINAYLPFGALILSVLNALISFALIAVLFAAIYKVLPDRRLEWRDVIVGAIVTSILFTIGKSLIGWYLGTVAVASSYGAAGALMIVLLWVYYSSQIFLLGAEFTKAFSGHYGSRQGEPALGSAPAERPMAES